MTWYVINETMWHSSGVYVACFVCLPISENRPIVLTERKVGSLKSFFWKIGLIIEIKIIFNLFLRKSKKCLAQKFTF